MHFQKDMFVFSEIYACQKYMHVLSEYKHVFQRSMGTKLGLQIFFVRMV